MWWSMWPEQRRVPVAGRMWSTTCFVGKGMCVNVNEPNFYSIDVCLYVWEWAVWDNLLSICFFFTLSGFSFTSPTFLTVVGRERRLMLSTSTFGLCGLVPYTSKFRFVRSISRTSLPPRLPMVPVRQKDYRYDDNHPLGTRKIHRSDGSFEQQHKSAIQKVAVPQGAPTIQSRWVERKFRISTLYIFLLRERER